MGRSGPIRGRVVVARTPVGGMGGAVGRVGQDKRTAGMRCRRRQAIWGGGTHLSRGRAGRAKILDRATGRRRALSVSRALRGGRNNNVYGSRAAACENRLPTRPQHHYRGVRRFVASVCIHNNVYIPHPNIIPRRARVRSHCGRAPGGIINGAVFPAG